MSFSDLLLPPNHQGDSKPIGGAIVIAFVLALLVTVIGGAFFIGLALAEKPAAVSNDAGYGLQ